MTANSDKSRRPMLRTIFLLCVLCVLCGKSPAAPPHILLIMADDIGIEAFTCYGGVSYQTPHLDQLAATGLRFTHASSQPLCTPTRLELMTGRDNHRNWLSFGILPPAERTFGHLMQGFGYKTCIAGKWQLHSYDPPDWPNAGLRRGTGMRPEDAGFDNHQLYHAGHTEGKGSRYANPTYLRDGVLHANLEGEYGEDHNVEYILDFMTKNKSAPMFVYYPMSLPHCPMVPTPISEAWKDPARRLEESTDFFPDMVEYMDLLVGRLIEGIDKIGLRDKTLILFYSDNGTDRRITSRFHGRDIPGGKGLPEQPGIRVPLIANGPGVPEGALCRDLGEPSDFVPTLAALAGQHLPPGWQTDGRVFLPQHMGEKNIAPRTWAFFWYDPRPGWDKEKYSRSIFALDHNYKLFADGSFYHIEGETLREDLLHPSALTPDEDWHRRKLQKAIDTMMQQPISPAARIEVDAYGIPVVSDSSSKDSRP